jgi:superfamily II DNA/RNA helicase
MTSITFAALGVEPSVLDALERSGIREPFPIQALAIPDALAGRDVCAKAQTGSGKTLAFAIPMAQRLAHGTGHSPRGLVLVPTRELALQVVGVVRTVAEPLGLRVTAVYGGVALERQHRALRRGTDIVVATPGRLIDLVERRMVGLDGISVAVLDEADRMTDMGFLPQVSWLLRRFRHHRPQLMLFSATLDGAVAALVRDLHDPVHHEVPGTAPTVEAMTHRFLAVHQMDRVKVAAAIARGVDRTLVFVRTKRGADRLVGQLRREGVEAVAIHGDLPQRERERALGAFAAGSAAALVATDIAARGIDVAGVDVVVHFDIAEDHRTYLHRSGRTARAGRSGLAVTFVLWNEGEAVRHLQRRLALDEPVVEVFSNDVRLADLRSLGSEAASA